MAGPHAAGSPLRDAAPAAGQGYHARAVPTPRPPQDLFEAVAAVRRSGREAALATVIGTRGSTPGKDAMRLLVYEDGTFLGTVGGGCVEADVVDACLDVLQEARPRRLTFRLTENATGRTGLMCGGELEVFVEPIGVPSLVVFGAGHISRDLCTIAQRAGFRVTVVDDRDTFACRERFPDAAEVIAAPTFEEAFGRLEVTAGTYCVIVTRGHAYDLECLGYALSTPARYVGLIGSQGKVRGILRKLGAQGLLGQADLARLHAPIGLALGGGTHGEIAVSIVAELIAERHGTTGHARMRLEPDEAERLRARTAAPPTAPVDGASR